MKYFVIATVFDDRAGAQIQKIVGAFDVYHLAHLFADAYNNHYHATATVVSADKLACAIEF